MVSATPSREWDFLFGFLRRPHEVASLFPSSAALARTVARQVDPSCPGPVIELGPGTGAVTSAILESGVPPDKLIVFEIGKAFAADLRDRFPGVRVIEGDAFDFAAQLRSFGIAEPLSAVVSGLPVRSQSMAIRQELLSAALASLWRGAPFVQYSYGWRSPFSPSDSSEITMAAAAWHCALPIRVWTYRAPRNY